MSDERIRILLADDHALVREGIRRVLEEDPEFVVVAEAADGEEAVLLAREHRPDVAVVDITMPGASGFEVTARLQSDVSATRVLILSMHDDAEYVTRAVRAGARGYLLKDEAGPSQLRDAVRAVHAGSSFFTSAVADRLAAGLRGVEQGQQAPGMDVLTARELDVLKGVAAGKSNKQIAAHLGISRRTVESHRESLMRKLDIRTVAGLTRFALDGGLLDDATPY
ncbi:MAG: response regulator transcription factor [Candidatus Palauibacterales bacterium]|jgi:DNA-binding NarL/FixJ family response regulator|nr:response regulator transcription factor [Candidatus Palauibacterales bacterium]MDP2482322.1 response regulator transcription factor [Candidatus Palauibacterales bacterium]